MEYIRGTATFSSNRFMSYFAQDSSLFHICRPETKPPSYNQLAVFGFLGFFSE